jgi:beta-N-acetylhexosaminidase
MPISEETLASRLLCVGFDGETLPAEAQGLISRGVGFAVLFARNVKTPEQVAKLNASIKDASPTSIAICVDQEGGRVRRLRDGFSQVPAMREIGRVGTRLLNGRSNGVTNGKHKNGNGHHRTIVCEVGSILGKELRAVGFDVNFAPVLDVDTNPRNPVIADRSLARDAREVARLGCEMITGLQSAGVAACGKHFPGHGDTSVDSHHALPRLDHDLKRLNEIELVPFVAATQAGCESMMTSHIVFTPLDSELPATLSPIVLDGLLRKQIGFQGVIFTDDMEMKSIANFYDFDESVVRTIEAGADVVTICHSLDKQKRALEVIAAAIRSGRLSRDRIDQSIARIDRLHERYVKPVQYEPSVLDCAEHRYVLAHVEMPPRLPDPTEYTPH